MKITSILNVFLVLFLLFCSQHQVESAKIRSKSKSKGVGSAILNFGLGVAQALTGGTLSECLEGFGIKITAAMREDNEHKGWVSKMDGMQGVFKWVSWIVGAVTGLICGDWMGTIIKIVKAIFGLFKLKIGFTQLKSEKKFFGKIFRAIKKAVHHVARGITRVVQHVVKKVVHVAKKIGRFVVKAIKTVVNVVRKVANAIINVIAKAWKFLTDFIPSVKKVLEKIKNFFGLLGRMIPKVRSFIGVLLACGNAVSTFLTNIINVYSAVVLLVSSGGTYAALFPKFILNLICAWELIVGTIETLTRVFTASNWDIRMFQMGKFLGQVLVIFGTVVGGLREFEPAKKGIIKLIMGLRDKINKGMGYLGKADSALGKAEAIFGKFSLVETGHSVPGPVKKNCAVIYEHPNYQGKHTTLCAKYNDLRRIGFNNIVSSIRLGDETSIRIYDRADFQGSYLKITRNIHHLEKWADKVGSIVIKHGLKPTLPDKLKAREGCALVYQKHDYKGNFMEICSAVEFLRPMGFEDTISSVRVGKHTSLRLYEHRNFVGKYGTFTHDTPRLHKMNDMASSARVSKGKIKHDRPLRGCAMIYQDKDYLGKSYEVCEGFDDLDRVGMNNNLSSIRVAKKMSAVLFDYVDFEGPKLVVNKNLKYVGDAFDNKTSSVLIYTKKIKKNKVPPGCIRLYSKKHWKGDHQDFCNVYDSARLGTWNNKAQSLKVGKETWAMVYSDNFRGITVEVKRNIANLARYKLNKEISSLQARSVLMP